MAVPADAHTADDCARHVRRCLPEQLRCALRLLPNVSSTVERRKLAVLIAQCWARVDINAAWNAVSLSKLNAADKQTMFNELWN